jgi:hypothetical protein
MRSDRFFKGSEHLKLPSRPAEHGIPGFKCSDPLKSPLKTLCFGLALVASPLAAQGFDSFTPSRCAVAPSFLEPIARRDDTVSAPFAPRGDTLRTATVAALRLCERVYGGLTTDDRELLNLARVKLALGADSAAAAARQKYLQTLTSRPVRERAWAFYLIIYDDVTARPPRLADAGRTLEHLDQLPVTEAGKARVLAHHIMSEGWRRQWDDTKAEAEADAVIATWKTLPVNRRNSTAFTLALAFLLKSEIRLRTMGVDSAKAVIDTAKALVPETARQARYYIDITNQMYGALGKPAAPIRTDFTFNDPDPARPERPSRGKVTVLSSSFHYCGMSCRERYRAMARLLERFGPAGLELINTTRTFGFFADTAPVTPAEEASRDSAYFLGTIGVPGILAVAQTKVTWLPDGRRRDEPTPRDANYPYASFVVVDKERVVRYVALDWDPVLEEPLAQLLRNLLGGG